MSETNGQNGLRLDRLEASHVKLMTDYGLFLGEHKKFLVEHEKWVKEQDRAWERHREFVAEQEARDKVLDKRIADLVSGIGEFMLRGK